MNPKDFDYPLWKDEFKGTLYQQNVVQAMKNAQAFQRTEVQPHVNKPVINHNKGIHHVHKCAGEGLIEASECTQKDL
jgi:hypothetical protein